MVEGFIIVHQKQDLYLPDIIIKANGGKRQCSMLEKGILGENATKESRQSL